MAEIDELIKQSENIPCETHPISAEIIPANENIAEPSENNEPEPPVEENSANDQNNESVEEHREIKSQDKPESPSGDPLSLENENQREMELMDEISNLQFELLTAQRKMDLLQNNVQELNTSKIIADSFLNVSFLLVVFGYWFIYM
jgi:hypothetical protein